MGLCLNLVISQKIWIVLANKIESHKIPNDAGNSFTTALLFYVLLFSMGFYEVWYDFKSIWTHCVSHQGRAFEWRVAGLGWMTHVRRLDNQIYMEQIKKFSAPNIATTCCNKVIELFNPLNSILCKLSCPIHGFLVRIILRCLLWCNSELKI